LPMRCCPLRLITAVGAIFGRLGARYQGWHQIIIVRYQGWHQIIVVRSDTATVYIPVISLNLRQENVPLMSLRFNDVEMINNVAGGRRRFALDTKYYDLVNFAARPFEAPAK